MNDIEVLVLLFGVAVACYYIGRYRKDYDHRAERMKLNSEWTKKYTDLRLVCDVLILKTFAEQNTLLFYADHKNWLNGSIANDEGSLARKTMNIPEPDMSLYTIEELN